MLHVTLGHCRQEAKEVESEYQRVESEGPASHRKKDLLDKATKEAEHRERLQVGGVASVYRL